jgi:hypothetical protein
VSAKHNIGAAVARFLATCLPKRILMSPRYFEIWESRGYHVVPVSASSPIPCLQSLSRSIWSRESELPGIEMASDKQLRLLHSLKFAFKEEYDAFPRYRASDRHRFHLGNGWFEKVDAEIYYSLIRHWKPKRIIEVGSGVTTILAAEAILRNQEDNPDYRCQFVAIEPFPVRIDRDYLPPEFQLIQESLEDVPLDRLIALDAGDFLFIDSSHVCRINSDVHYEIAEILPRLKRGVIIHFHDIFLPYEYPRVWVMEDKRFLNEQYMLQAFLAFNDAFEVLWGSYHMARKYPDQVAGAFASFSDDISGPGRFLPGSFWIRRR